MLLKSHSFATREDPSPTRPTARLRHFCLLIFAFCLLIFRSLRRSRTVYRLALLLAVIATSAPAQSPPEVLVVLNRTSAVSQQIARYYAQRRSIPARNLCALEVTPEETIARSVYEEKIAAPIAAFLKAANLVDRILYIVTTLGVPLRISGSYLERDTDAAAVDSELTLLYQIIHGKKPPLRGPLPNPFFMRRDEPFRHPRFPIYLVTRLAAYDFADVKAMIDRSMVAVNRGKFVLDLSSSDDKTGNDWLRTAAILLPKDRVVIDETTAVLYGQREVIGYASWGSNDPHRKRRFLGFEWLPGAIVTEFVSSDGRTFVRPPDSWNITTWKDTANFFARSPQSLTADYLHEGATGASGHVYEPYLAFTPRPDYLLPAYFSDRTLAESYYLSIPALSWQNIVAGDPLCRLKKDIRQKK